LLTMRRQGTVFYADYRDALLRSTLGLSIVLLKLISLDSTGHNFCGVVRLIPDFLRESLRSDSAINSLH
jgi:hypothetical protein